MKIRSFLVATLLLIPAAFSQTNDGGRPQIGTINGQPLLGAKPIRALNAFVMKHGHEPQSQADKQELAALAAKNNCDEASAEVRRSAREREKQLLAVYVSPEEVSEATKQYWATHDAAQEFQQQRSRWLALNQAAAEVFDQHQDPEKVYQTLLAPIGESHQAWQINLTRWSRPDGRAALAKMAAAASGWTLDTFKKGMDSASRQQLEDRKLNDSVDAQLAAEDSTFRTDLATQKKAASGTLWEGKEGPQSDYLRQKRQQFWQARYAEQPVKFNDPALAQQCEVSILAQK